MRNSRLLPILAVLALAVLYSGDLSGSAIYAPLYYAPGTPPYNPSWYALQQIDWDPGNLSTHASDSNSCTGGINNSCLTWAEIVRRYGSNAPTLTYGNSIKVNQHSAQAAGVDPVFFFPKLSGGGQASLIGDLVAAACTGCGSPVTAGTVTAKVQGGPGTLLQIASMPAGSAAGMLVCNSTRSNSCAYIDSMSSSTATMQQPVAATGYNLPTGLPNPSENNAWSTGDTLNIYTPILSNLKAWHPTSGDLVSGSGQLSMGFVQFLEIADPSGSGTSSFGVVADGVNVISMCRVDPRLHVSYFSGRGDGVYIIGSTMMQSIFTFAGAPAFAFGGAAATGITIQQGGGMNVDGDIIIHSTWALNGFAQVGNAYSNGTVSVGAGGAGGQLKLSLLTSGVSLWGSGALTMSPQGTVYLPSGTFAADLLLSGAIKLGASTTGCAFLGGMQCGIALTAANMDKYVALSDPETGAKFSLTTGSQVSQSQQTIACSTGGTQTVAANPTPQIIVTSGTLTSNCTLDFSVNAALGCFDLDMSGVTLGATFGVVFSNGTATKTYTSAGVLSGTLARICTHGANTLAVNF